MGLNLEDILSKLDEEKTAEEDFEESLSDSESKVDSEKAEKEAAEEGAESDEEQEEKEAADSSAESDETEEEEEVKEASEEEEDNYEKLASDLEQQGRIMAQGFVDELNKLASGQDTEGDNTSEEDETKTAAEQSENIFADEVAESLMTQFH